MEKDSKVIKLNGIDITAKLTTETQLSVEKAFGMLLTERDIESLKTLSAIIDGLPETATLERTITTTSKKTGKQIITTKRLSIQHIKKLMAVAKSLVIDVDSNRQKSIGINKLAEMVE